MALGTNHIRADEVTSFIPELWSDEVIADFKRNLVMAMLVRRYDHTGKKGDTIKVPTYTRAVAQDVSSETALTFIQHGTDSTVDVAIDKHKAAPRVIEDLVEVQALRSLREVYTDDMGYSLALAADRDLILEAALGLAGTSITATNTASTFQIENNSNWNPRIGDDSAAWDPSANANAGNATALNDDGVRSFIKRLDDEDAPHVGRSLVVPTVTKQTILGIPRYTEQAFTGEAGAGSPIRSGYMGDLYGVDVYCTTNLPTVEDDGEGSDQKLGLMFQRDALVFVEQKGMSMETDRDLEYLATLVVASMVYGVKLLRDGSSIPFVVPA